MSAIRFPLVVDSSGAANPISPQEGAKLSAGGPSSSLQPDVVTLSAVFPSPPPAEANQAQSQNLGQPALEAFPPPAPSPSNAVAISAAEQPTLTQQEQLAQLNRALERLGISPQSISLDNRLALIRSANDPPALLNLVRALGVLSGPVGTSPQPSGANANSLPNPAQAAAQAQTSIPLEIRFQASIEVATLSATSLQNSGSPAGSGLGASLPATSSSGETDPSAQNVVQNNAAAQFQDLQQVFQAAESQQNASGIAGPTTNSPQAPTSTISILA